MEKICLVLAIIAVLFVGYQSGKQSNIRNEYKGTTVEIAMPNGNHINGIITDYYLGSDCFEAVYIAKE